MVEFPPILTNELHVVPLNRAATTVKICVVEVARQTTAPDPSLPQPGAPTTDPLRVLKGLHEVPLNIEEVKPPVVFLATHRTLPAVSGAQLGSKVICPPAFVSALQAVPL